MRKPSFRLVLKNLVIDTSIFDNYVTDLDLKLQKVVDNTCDSIISEANNRIHHVTGATGKSIFKTTSNFNGEAQAKQSAEALNKKFEWLDGNDLDVKPLQGIITVGAIHGRVLEFVYTPYFGPAVYACENKFVRDCEKAVNE